MSDKPRFAEAFDLPGGPAFPISIPGAGDNGAHGMSLRDWFAGQALAGLLTGNPHRGSARAFAAEAYKCADEMLIERRQRT